MPDNNIVIDNPAVSGRHARVYREGNHYVLEDLKSTNGTFVNDKPIARHTLLEGDIVLVGKHTLLFTQKGGEQDETQAEQPFVPEIGGTRVLDTRQAEEVARGRRPGRPSQVYDAVVPKTAIPTAQGRIGTIKVVSGNTGQSRIRAGGGDDDDRQGGDGADPLEGMVQAEGRRGDRAQGRGLHDHADGRQAVGERRARQRAASDLASGDLIEVSGAHARIHPFELEPAISEIRSR